MQAPARHFPVAILGAGAAGLMTAITARRLAPSLEVALLEGRPRPGAKILVSGGGRCNVTSHAVVPADFHGPRRLIARVLGRLGVAETIAFFASIGVELVEEPPFGKLFPADGRARSVLEALLGECARLGVQRRDGFRVETVGGSDRFALEGPRGGLTCDRLVLATGGRSLPRSGSDGHGYQLARALGHHVGPTAPALVPLLLAPHPLGGLAGVSFPAAIGVWRDGRKQAEVEGPLLVTHFGLSGPAALDVSRHWSSAGETRPQLQLSVFPGETPGSLERRWLDLPRAARVVRLLDPLPERLGRALLRLAGIDEDTALSRLEREPRRRLLAVATALPLPVAGTRGWNEAEVTAGGVPLDEIDPATMESRRRRGLYLVGEILDVDGRIGGFNFQWAWASGHVAGQALAGQEPRRLDR